MRYKLISASIFLSILSAFVTQGLSQENPHQPLLNSGEKVLLSFAIQDALEDSTKILTVATSEDDSYIVYRFGQQDTIEIEYPKDKRNSWDKFVYSNYSRNIGNDSLKLHLNYLEFTDEAVSYRIYDSSAEEVAITFVGVRVTDRSKGSSGEAFNVVDIQAIPSSKIGSLNTLREHGKIKRQSAFAIPVVEQVDSDSVLLELPSEEAVVTSEAIQEVSEEVPEIQEVSETLTIDVGGVDRLELQIATSSMSSQELLQRVQEAFNQLKDDTLNIETDISYWTSENETAVSNVQTKVQEIQEKYGVAKETVAQLRTVTIPEEQQKLLDELSTINNEIIELTATLEELEATALSSFEDTQERFLNRIESNLNSNNDAVEIDPEVIALEQEMTDLVASSQSVLQGVQQDFNQLIQDTLNKNTGVSYWTQVDEDALANVQSQVQEAERNYDLVTQSLAQVQTAATIEEQELLVAKVFNHYEAIKEISLRLPELENIAKSSFELSRTKYNTRNSSQLSNTSQVADEVNEVSEITEVSAISETGEKSFRLLLGQCAVSAYEEEACQRSRNLIYSLGYGVGEQNDGTVVAFVIGPFVSSQISGIQAQLLTEYGIASARVP